jgi:hypothetical protein
VEGVWIRALLGEGGYLTGAEAEAAASDAMIVPVVATMDATALDTIINLALGAFGHHSPDRAAHRDQTERLSGDAAASSRTRKPLPRFPCGSIRLEEARAARLRA